MPRKLSLLAIGTLVLLSQVKRPPGQFENDRVSVESVVYADRESVKRMIGHDFDGSVAVVEMTVTPRGGEALDVEREDWILFSNKDAQKAPAFHPSQLAGQGALVIKEQRGGGGVMAGNNPNAPVIGGIPGTGGRPRQMGSPGGGGIGNSASQTVDTTVAVKDDEKANPILATLKAKEMPFGKTLKPVKGLLYFSLDGKHKLKDLELWYRGPAGKFVISYKPQ
ncbi:MAG TPA: hypothetical protein VFQ91_01765 [Bryobacteraceae bacterium]|nr:hypothetical protein [Bryobacteraceae bacterium]